MPLPVVYRTHVAPDWIDYNGHMRDGYYVVAFSSAIDALMDEIGLDEAYRTRTGCTLYTLEIHVHYLAEAKLGEPLLVRPRVCGLDEKRLHALLLMERGDGTLVAVQDAMLMHVDQNAGPRAAAFPESVHARLSALLAEHGDLPAEKHVSRAIGLARRGG